MRIFVAGLLFTALSFGASMTGWISDSSCGKGNAKADAEARECTKSCLKNGATPVFVSDADQKVYKLAGKDVKDHLDYKVKITGQVTGDTIAVQDIRKAD